MKNLFYVLFAAMLLVACSPDDPKIVLKDQLMLKKVSQNALDQLGKQQADVSDALLKLGYKEVVDKSQLPARLRKPAFQNGKLAHKTFSYNAPKGKNVNEFFKSEDKTEIVDFINQIVDSRKVFVIAYVSYDSVDNVVQDVQGILYAGREVDDINHLYRNFSNNIYAALGYEDINEDKSWDAELTDDSGKEHEYAADERSEFMSDFEKVTYPEVVEHGTDVRGKMNRRYSMTWSGDAEMDLEGAKPVCAGMFYAYTY